MGAICSTGKVSSAVATPRPKPTQQPSRVVDEAVATYESSSAPAGDESSSAPAGEAVAASADAVTAMSEAKQESGEEEVAAVEEVEPIVQSKFEQLLNMMLQSKGDPSVIPEDFFDGMSEDAVEEMFDEVEEKLQELGVPLDAMTPRATPRGPRRSSGPQAAVEAPAEAEEAAVAEDPEAAGEPAEPEPEPEPQPSLIEKISSFFSPRKADDAPATDAAAEAGGEGPAEGTAEAAEAACEPVSEAVGETEAVAEPEAAAAEPEAAAMEPDAAAVEPEPEPQPSLIEKISSLFSPRKAEDAAATEPEPEAKSADAPAAPDEDPVVADLSISEEAAPISPTGKVPAVAPEAEDVQLSTERVAGVTTTVATVSDAS